MNRTQEASSFQEICDYALEDINDNHPYLLAIGFEVAYTNSYYSAWGDITCKNSPYSVWRGIIWTYWNNVEASQTHTCKLKQLGIHFGTGGLTCYGNPFARMWQDAWGKDRYPKSHDAVLFIDDFPNIVMASTIDPTFNIYSEQGHKFHSIWGQYQEKPNDTSRKQEA